MTPRDDFNVDEGNLDPDDEGAWARDEAASTGTFMFPTPHAGERAVKELYAVFRRPRNDADRRAGELACRSGTIDVGIDRDEEVDRELRDLRAALGDVVAEEGRLVLTGLGGDEDMLYAAPTTTGAIAHECSRRAAADAAARVRTASSSRPSSVADRWSSWGLSQTRSQPSTSSSKARDGAPAWARTPSAFESKARRRALS